MWLRGNVPTKVMGLLYLQASTAGRTETGSTGRETLERLDRLESKQLKQKQIEKMVGRVLVSSASMALRKSPQFKILLSKFHIFKPFSYNKYPFQRIRYFSLPLSICVKIESFIYLFSKCKKEICLIELRL